MVDLKARPYCLSDADISWVESTIASMTAEEKVGQLFFQLTASPEEAYLKELMEKYHLGGCRYNGMPGARVLAQDVGSKAACIAAMLDQGYRPEHVLMVGDAPGDLDAARKNGVHYYPILVNREKESWQEAVATAFDRLRSGTYAPYGAEMEQAFLDNLSSN